MSGHHDFFEDLEAKTPQEKALADEYEQLTRAFIRLARLREQRGVTQKELAEALHVAQPTVSKFERGDDMRLTTLSKYLSAMGGGLRLTAVFDDEEVDLGLLRQNAPSHAHEEGRQLKPVSAAFYHNRLPPRQEDTNERDG